MSQKILLVEDDPALVAGLKFSLEKDGYEVDRAGSVREGKEALQAARYDLILLDIGLPDGTGFDLCRFVREKSSVPVLFLTACDDEVNVVMGLDMGGDDYITKPFRLGELLSRVRALLRRTMPPQGSGLIESQGLLLNTAECRLYKGGREVLLTPVEYRLLQTLISNPRRTLTRDQLLAKLWDNCGGEFVDANTLTVYIRRLREKVEDEPSTPRLIATVRGVGYKWDAESAPAAPGRRE